MLGPTISVSVGHIAMAAHPKAQDQDRLRGHLSLLVTYVQAYGPTVGSTPVWDVATNGDVEAIVVSSSVVYVSGHFTSVGGSGRGHLAALLASGGGLTSWNPGANGNLGASGAAITGSRVAFGGEFTRVASETHQSIVQFSGTP
jgi:hypothetical protein